MLKKTPSIIFIVVQFVAEALLIFTMISSDMFPMIYIVAAAVVGILLLLASAALAFYKLEEKSESSIIARRIAAIALAVILSAVAIFACLVMNKVGNTVSGITSDNTVKKIVGVYVLADDPAKTIGDVAYYSFGYSSNYDAENTNKAIKDINSKIGREIDAKDYEDSMEMVRDLYNCGIDAIILDESYASLIEDQDEFADFMDDTKIVYEFEIVTEANNAKKPSGDLSSFVVYLSGSDTRNKKLSISRSDVNILMTVNTKTKEILLVNTPRDYYVPISKSSSGTRDKLTHCGIYGIDCSIDTLAAFYKQDIDYYAQINFTGFETLIDSIGGVTVNADAAFSNSKVSVTEGENHLNGSQALAFARDRHHQAGGDRGRGKNQMKLIAAVIDKMSAGTILANYSSILESLQGMFVTNMPSEDINALIKMQLSDMSSWHIHSYSVTGSDGSSTTYSMPGTRAYVMYPDQKMVDHVTDLMTKVLKGEKITDADVK